jgi:hypothetical protein
VNTFINVVLDFPRNLNANGSFQNEEAESGATVDIASILKDFKATPTIIKDVNLESLKAEKAVP